MFRRVAFGPFTVLLAASLTTSVWAQNTEPVKVELVTSEGTITLELYPDKAPKTVENFVKYAESGHYEGTIFHRVIKDFMIQGGGMTKDLREKPTMAPIRNEAGNQLTNEKYTVAMARMNLPHSATSQFFINTTNNRFLNRAESQDGYGYAVFGKVIEGQEVVDKIGNTPTRVAPDPRVPGGLMSDVPVEPITIQSVKVAK